LDAPALIVLGVAAFVQGVFGFGFGIIAMAVLTMTHDLAWASGIVNLTTFVLSGIILARLRGGTLWRVVGRLLPGVVVGLILGTAALAWADRDLLVRLLGVTIVAVAAWNLADVRPPARESLAADTVAGLAGGFLSGAFNTGGPPVVARLYARPEAPERLKATMQVVFLVMGVLRVPVAAAQGLFSAAVLRGALIGVPVVALGTILGVAFARRFDAARFRRACWAALGVLGAVLLVAG
jgi:uncharacterized membrane protein YfcA